MEISQTSLKYDENFSATKNESQDSFLINNLKEVATTKNYRLLGGLAKDPEYIFSHNTDRYVPIYCTPSYNGCNSCVNACVGCNSGCQTSCQNTCYAGCNSGCTSSCQSCQNTCNSGCTSGCASSCNGCTGYCQSSNGCTSCNNCQSECNTSNVGCPSALYTKGMVSSSTYYCSGCNAGCNSKYSCSAYNSSCTESCHQNYQNTSCSGACHSNYSCVVYVACASSCMACNASGYTCSTSSCYSKVYKY